MVATLALLTGLLSVAGTEVASAHCGAVEVVSLRTFHIDMKFPTRVAIGETAKIKVNVTSPAKEDPLGQGIPMERPFVEPQPDVIVGVGLMVGRVFLPGAAITDENGDGLVRIRMEKWAPKNKPVHVSSYAWRIVQQTPCLTVQEEGYRAWRGAFRSGN